MRLVFLTCLTLVGSACERRPQEAPSFTLYRNSPADRSSRVHWGTFDVQQVDASHNRHNCEMAARLLNANANASKFIRAGREVSPRVGFWCEPGRYSPEGSVPTSFEAKFPTDVPRGS